MMVSDSMGIQQQLEGCGALLRGAREKAGLGLDEVATRLKMPVKVLQALESEQWQQLGAPVFVRGQLRSYAKLLKTNIDDYLQQVELEVVRPAELVSHAHTSTFERFLESIKRRAIYVVLTVVLVVPVWMGAKSQLGTPSPQQTASLDVVPDTGTQAGPAQNEVVQGAESQAPATPYVASLMPLARNPAAALVLTFNGESWMQVSGPDGQTLEQALMKPGDTRSYAANEISRVILGNAAAVMVQHAGSTVDIVPFQRANVARFTVSSDGSLTPVAD